MDREIRDDRNLTVDKITSMMCGNCSRGVFRVQYHDKDLFITCPQCNLTMVIESKDLNIADLFTERRILGLRHLDKFPFVNEYQPRRFYCPIQDDFVLCEGLCETNRPDSCPVMVKDVSEETKKD